MVQNDLTFLSGEKKILIAYITLFYAILELLACLHHVIHSIVEKKLLNI